MIGGMNVRLPTLSSEAVADAATARVSVRAAASKNSTTTKTT